MAYNYHTGNGHSYYFHPAMESQVYGGKQYEADMRWDMNTVDPILLNDSTMEEFQAWNVQGHPMQVRKFLGEPERAWFSMPSLPIHSHIDLNGIHEAQAPFPSTNDYPGDCLSSTESNSALSPRPESVFQDSYYSKQSFSASSPLSRSMSHLSHAPQDSWHDGMPPAMPIFNGLVSLSDLQGQPDPEEVTYQDDEGYNAMSDRDFTFDIDAIGKAERSSRHHRDKSDSAIGQSVKGEDDAESTIIVIKKAEQAVDDEADADADGDPEEEETIEVAQHTDEEVSDPEYSPTTRTSKRKRITRSAPSSNPTPSPKRAKSNDKSTTATTKGNKHKCPSCTYTGKDVAALTKHIASQHTRPYVCTFAFAGCGSTFGNKNEWKRHVASQHLGLKIWVCTKGACAAKCGDGVTSGAVFNRKDLFTQHLRRMHAPFKVKRQGKSDAKWDAEVVELQATSERAVRSPPGKTRCPVLGCETDFEGTNGWDDRMEHLGRHLEGEKEKGGVEVVVVEERDGDLMDWAVGQGIIERRAGGWVFANGVAKDEEDGEEDAEGEDDI